MKKLLKWSAIIASSIIVLLILAVLVLPFFLPLDKIKDIATQKISETINRQVKIEKVSFSIFEGIKLEGLTVSNREGYAKKPFVSADAIVLRYAFWPIFKRQIIVKEISLVKPEILVEKSVGGEFNFSDLAGKGKNIRTSDYQKEKVGGPEDQKTAGFSIIVDSFSIKNGKITYNDYSTNLTNEIKDANLSVSGITLSMLKPIGFKASAVATYKDKDIPISLSGKAGLKLKEQEVSIPSLALDLAGEKANISATISNWSLAPTVDIAISSKKLTVDPLLAIFASGEPKKKAKKGELTKTVDKATASIKNNYHVKAKLDIENLGLMGFKVDKVKLAGSLNNKQINLNIDEVKLYGGNASGQAKINLAASGLAYNINKLKLEGFDSTPFVNDVVDAFLTKLDDYQDLKNKVYGKLDLSLNLSGKGVETEAILANAVGDGSFKLTGGEIKRVKILANVGKAIKSNTLQDTIKFDDLSAGFSFAKRIITVKDLKLESGDLKIKFNGGIDLANLVWVKGNRLNLKASPQVTKELAKEFNVFRDKNNWLEVDFEITGSLKLPIPVPVLDKPMEKAIEGIKIKLEAKKVEIVKQAEDKAKQEGDKLKEQAQEEAKKQLKNLLNF